MIIVPIKENDSIDKALKRLKKKFDKIGIKKEIRQRQEFTKKSVIRREQLRKAIDTTKRQMQEAARKLDFITAAQLRDKMLSLMQYIND